MMLLLNPTLLGLAVGQVGMPDLEWQSSFWSKAAVVPGAFEVTGAGVVCLDCRGHWDSCGEVVAMRQLWSL